MKIGVVTDCLRLCRQIGELEETQVLLVQTQRGELAAQALVDAKPGDRVLVVGGTALHLSGCFVDAAVVAVVENTNSC